MPFPIIPLLAIAALLGGGGTLAWYSRLSQAERDEADRKANEYARTLFHKALDELNARQATQVHERVKGELA